MTETGVQKTTVCNDRVREWNQTQDSQHIVNSSKYAAPGIEPTTDKGYDLAG